MKTARLLLLVAFIFPLYAPAKWPAKWDLNDVTYLMSLPRQLPDTEGLNINSQGAKGPLLTSELIEGLPILAENLNRDQAQELLRVMAVRIDPCFPLPTPASCQKQIRLVWQPVVFDGRNQVTTLDAAIHSFYVLTDSEFSQLLKKIQLWKTQYKIQTAGLPLQIHPAWEKNQTPAQKEFQKIILQFAGTQNLSRVTIMILRNAGSMWTFAAFEPRNADWSPIPIPRLSNRGSQVFSNIAFPFDSFRGGLAPAPQGADTLNNLITDSNKYLQGNEELIRQEFQSSVRIENPKNFSPENMDCVSCHLAQATQQWALDKRADLKLRETLASFAYKNPSYDLSNLSSDIKNTRSIRGIGYFGRNQVLSQRVINESAEVADALNKLLAHP